MRPTLLLLLIPLLFLSGCMAAKIKASGSPSGQLFCNESNCVLPKKIRFLVLCRHKAYHAMNQIDYGKLHFDCDLSDECYNKLMDLRYNLAHLNRYNDSLIEDLKHILRKNPCDEIDYILDDPTQETEHEQIAELITQIHHSHSNFMEKFRCLSDATKPYRPSFLEKFFFL